AAGYTVIFTSRVRERADHVIGRIAIKNQWEIDKFISIMRNGVSLPEQGKELVKDSVKKIIGAGRYDALRTKILRQ
ncbi:MAG: hypothetical protein KBA46_04415, partial [Candidatus Omnitrophica bacterium]|nr:hypothetical protein [Candidatus Omnitrophota bacterium]